MSARDTSQHGTRGERELRLDDGRRAHLLARGPDNVSQRLCIACISSQSQSWRTGAGLKGVEVAAHGVRRARLHLQLLELLSG